MHSQLVNASPLDKGSWAGAGAGATIVDTLQGHRPLTGPGATLNEELFFIQRGSDSSYLLHLPGGWQALECKQGTALPLLSWLTGAASSPIH